MMTMMTWGEFARASPDLASAGQRLFTQHQVAYLATVRSDGAPRIHPVIPTITNGGLYLFIPPESPKCRDLRRDARYALHAMLGDNDEEFTVRGAAEPVDAQQQWQTVADHASYPVEADHVLFELHIEICLWGIWEQAGQPDMRPVRRRWPTST